MDHQFSTGEKQWYVGKWPFLAWLETIIKSIAFGIGFYALTMIIRTNSILALPSGVRLAQFGLQALLTLGLIAAIFNRIQEHEIIAMIFIIFNNLGHIGILAGLMTNILPASLRILFWLLMMIGDITKIFFLKAHHFTVRGAAPAVMFGLTFFYLFGYFVLIMLQLLA